MDLSKISLPFFLQPLRLIPYYSSRLTAVIERVRAAYRHWIDRGKNELFGPLEQVIAACVVLALALQSSPQEAISSQRVDTHFPFINSYQRPHLPSAPWRRGSHFYPSYPQSSGQGDHADASGNLWPPGASVVIIVLLLANIALLLTPDPLKQSLRRPSLMPREVLKRLNLAGGAAPAQGSPASTSQAPRDSPEPSKTAERDRSSGSTDISTLERTLRTEKGAPGAETTQLKDPEARQTALRRLNIHPDPEANLKTRSEELAKPPTVPASSEGASTGQKVAALTATPRGPPSSLIGTSEMEKPSKVRAVPDEASLSPEEREKLKLAMLKRRREKERRLAQEAAAKETSSPASPRTVSQVRTAESALDDLRTKRDDRNTHQGDRKEMTAEEIQKMRLAMKAKAQAKVQAEGPSTPNEAPTATPRNETSRSGSEQRAQDVYATDTTIKLTQSEKARLAKAAESKRDEDRVRQPASLRQSTRDDPTKRSSEISTSSTRSLTKSERARLTKAKDKLASAEKNRNDASAGPPQVQTAAAEPTPDAVDPSATSDTDASDSGMTTDDPLVAGDYRPLKSALKKSKKKTRQHKNIQHNYFMTMRGWRPALVPFPHGLHPKPHKPRHTLWWDNVPKDADHIMAPPPVPKLPETDVDEPESGAEAKADVPKADMNAASNKEIASKEKAEKSSSSSRDKTAGIVTGSSSRDRPAAVTGDRPAGAARIKEIDEVKLKERELRKQLEKKKLSEAAAQAVVDGSDKPRMKLDAVAERPTKPERQRSSALDAAGEQKDSRTDPASQDPAKSRDATKVKEAEKLKELEKRRQAEKLKEMEKVKAAKAAEQKASTIPSTASRGIGDVPQPSSVVSSATIPPGMDPQLAQHATQALLCVLLYQIHDQLAIILLAFFMYQYMIDRQKLAEAQKAAPAPIIAPPVVQPSASRREASSTQSRQTSTKEQALGSVATEGGSKRSTSAQAGESDTKSTGPKSGSDPGEAPKSAEKASRQTSSGDTEPAKSGQKLPISLSEVATSASTRLGNDTSSSRNLPTESMSRDAALSRAAEKSGSGSTELPREVPREAEPAQRKPSQRLESETPKSKPTHGPGIPKSPPVKELAPQVTASVMAEVDLRSKQSRAMDPRRARVEDDGEGQGPRPTVTATTAGLTPKSNDSKFDAAETVSNEATLSEKGRKTEKAEPSFARTSDRDARPAGALALSKKEMTPEMLEAYKRAKAAGVEQLEEQRSKSSATASMATPSNEKWAASRSADQLAEELTPESAESYRQAMAKAKATAEAAEPSREDQDPSKLTPALNQLPIRQPQQVKASIKSESRAPREARREMTPEMIEAYKRAKEAKRKEAASRSGKIPAARSISAASPTTALINEQPTSSTHGTAASEKDALPAMQARSKEVLKSGNTSESGQVVKTKREAQNPTGQARSEHAPEMLRRSRTHDEPSVQPEGGGQTDRSRARQIAEPEAAELSSANVARSRTALLSKADPRPEDRDIHKRRDSLNGPACAGDAPSAPAAGRTDKRPSCRPDDSAAETTTPGHLRPTVVAPEDTSQPPKPDPTNKRIRTTSGREITPNMLAAYEPAKREKRDRKRQELELEALKEQRRQRKAETHAFQAAASDGSTKTFSMSKEPVSAQGPVKLPLPSVEQHSKGERHEGQRPEDGRATGKAERSVYGRSEHEARGLTVSIGNEELGLDLAPVELSAEGEQEDITSASLLGTGDKENPAPYTTEAGSASTCEASRPQKLEDRHKESQRLGRPRQKAQVRGETEPEKAKTLPAGQASQTTVQRPKAGHTEPEAQDGTTGTGFRRRHKEDPQVDEGARSEDAGADDLKSVEHPKKSKRRSASKIQTSETEANTRPVPSESSPKTRKTEDRTAAQLQSPPPVATQRHKQDDPEGRAKRLSLERRLRLRKALRTPLRVIKKASTPGTPVSGPVRGDWPSVEPDELYALMQALEASCELDHDLDTDGAPPSSATPVEELTSTPASETDKAPPIQAEKVKEVSRRLEADETALGSNTAAKPRDQEQLKVDTVERKPSIKGKEKMTPEMLMKYEEARRRQLRTTHPNRGGSAAPDRPPKSAERRHADREQETSGSLPSPSRLPEPLSADPTQRPSRSGSSKRHKADMSAKELKAYEEAKRRAMEKRARHDAEAGGSKASVEKGSQEARPKIRMQDLTPEMVERMQREKEKRRLERARAKKEALGQGSSGLSPMEKEALSQPASPTAADCARRGRSARM